jgi:hypothetical protein
LPKHTILQVQPGQTVRHDQANLPTCLHAPASREFRREAFKLDIFSRKRRKKRKRSHSKHSLAKNSRANQWQAKQTWYKTN